MLPRIAGRVHRLLVGFRRLNTASVGILADILRQGFARVGCWLVGAQRVAQRFLRSSAALGGGTPTLDRRVTPESYNHAHVAASALGAVRSLVLHHLLSLATATASFRFRIRHHGAGDRGTAGRTQVSHWNPVKAGLVSRPEEWSRRAGSSVHDYRVQRPVVPPSGMAVARALLPGPGYNVMAKKNRRGPQKARTSALQGRNFLFSWQDL
jgi:hypothetical protein